MDKRGSQNLNRVFHMKDQFRRRCSYPVISKWSRRTGHPFTKSLSGKGKTDVTTVRLGPKVTKYGHKDNMGKIINKIEIKKGRSYYNEFIVTFEDKSSHSQRKEKDGKFVEIQVRVEFPDR